MLLKVSEIKSLGGHTYNRPQLKQFTYTETVYRHVETRKPDTRLGINSLIESIPSSLETKTPWWWARSPGPAGGTPGTWSQHSPRLCSTAES